MQGREKSPAAVKGVGMLEDFRRWPRYSISAKAVIRRRDAGSPEELITRVTTISQGGIGFYTDESMEKAAPVSVELFFYGSDDTGGDILEGMIASICPQESDYFVGIAFDREISYDRFIEIIG